MTSRCAMTAVGVALAALLAACGSAREIERSRIEACGRCHGYPPPPSMSGRPHPSDTDCVDCHASTVDEDNELLEGGAHLNGEVDTTGHPLPYVGQHAAAALGAIRACTMCHGAEYDGAVARSCTACHASFGFPDWRTNCTFCHGVRTQGWSGSPLGAAAPPHTVDGTDPRARVGAHEAHLNGGTYAGPLPCASCHAVPAPTFPESLDHLDGRARIRFGAVAAQGVANPEYAGGSCTVYCHGSSFLLGGGASPTPAWTSTALACDACHGLAPTSGLHGFHLASGVACGACHREYELGGSPRVNLATHVNGVADSDPVTIATTLSEWPAGCATCHPDGIPPP